jgi:hypothetical protein
MWMGHIRMGSSACHLFYAVSCSAYSSILETEVTCSSETSVDFQLSKQFYTPEDISLHNHRCENLQPYVGQVSLAHIL